MLPHNLPGSTYPKGYIYRRAYPNLYRDEKRDRLAGVVYANVDYLPQDSPTIPMSRSYVELSGGLPKQVKLDIDYPSITDEEEELEHILPCMIEEPLFKPAYPMTDIRSHIRLSSGQRRMVYLPSIRPVVTMPSVTGNVIVNANNALIRPDDSFIRETQQGITMWFISSAKDHTQVSSIHFNPCLVNLRFLDSEVKDSAIRHLAKTIKKQKHLEQFTFENGFLCATDAIRVVLGVAIGAGETLEKLYLCNLFTATDLPIETEAEYLDVYNEFKFDPKESPKFTVEMKNQIWNRLIEQPCFQSLPTSLLDKYFLLSLSSLSNLTVLMVNYTWLSKGNGLYLLRLDSIRNGKMRKLILVLTSQEQPKYSRQSICHSAWVEAVKMCPDLELHLVLVQNSEVIDFNSVFAKSMPLVSIHFSSIYSFGKQFKNDPWSFSYVTRYLRSYFSTTLRMIRLEVWQPFGLFDVSITNLLLKCSQLRVFIYRGAIDKLDTIHSLCEFLLEDVAMRIERIAFFITDDACRPQGWIEAIEAAKEKYEIPLALKGITLQLGIWKF